MGSRRREVIVRESTLEDRKTELLVVAAETRVQTLEVFNDRGLNLVETVGTIDVPNYVQCALATSLVCREKVPHSTGRVYVARQASIFSRLAGWAGWNRRRTAPLLSHDPVSYTHLTLPTICSV